MKNVSVLLAMLWVAATAFPQTSRRPANSSEPAGGRSTEAVSDGSENAIHNYSRSSRPDTERQTAQPVQNESRTSANDYSTHASSRQEPEDSRIRSEEEREDVSRSGYDYTPESSPVSTQRQVPVISGSRSVNDGANVSEPGTGNATVRGNTTTGVAREMPARHDESVQQGTRQQPDKSLYPSPRENNGNREVTFHYQQPPHSREYRRYHQPYPKPVHGPILWTPEMQSEYACIYPTVTYWPYPEGYRIETISAYDALFYSGEVVSVYGQVQEVYYFRPADEYILYFGAYYPYHDFTVVIPGRVARRFDNRPERYFQFAYVMVTGLVTLYDGVPEMYINRTYQINTY
jgi:hypothetical protein